MILRTLLILAVIFTVSLGDKPCKKRKTDYGYICVCDSKYCDTIRPPKRLPPEKFHIYYTSAESPGFNHHIGYFRIQPFSPHGHKYKINIGKRNQTIRGFGGAFTDSFGATFNTLSFKAQENLLRSFFSGDGLEYSLCRVALGSSDFSLRVYTYLPKYDPTLKSFNLTQDDYKYKIPHIRRAIKMASRPISLLGATWTPPNWMKTRNATSADYLRLEYHQLWADYHVKILDAFKKEGIEFWGLTTGNEPIVLYTIHAPIPNLVMYPEEQRDWVINHLGPALRKARYSTKIILMDDQRAFALWWMNTVFKNVKANDFVHGIGIHWYFDAMASPMNLNEIHEKYPGQEIMYTESSINPAVRLTSLQHLSNRLDLNRFKPTPPLLGVWRRAALYIENIIENLSHWVTSYIDWNLSLNLDGGPNIQNFSCDATIIVNKTSDEFYKEPMFYAMGHFSKFMHPQSIVIDVQEVASFDDSTSIQSHIQPHHRHHHHHHAPPAPTGKPPPPPPPPYSKPHPHPPPPSGKPHLSSPTTGKPHASSSTETPYPSSSGPSQHHQRLLHQQILSSGSSKHPPTGSPHPPPSGITVVTFPTIKTSSNVMRIGVINPDESTSIIFYNPKASPQEISFYDPQRGYGLLYLEAQSITTVVYW